MTDSDSDEDAWPPFGHPTGMNKSSGGEGSSHNLCKEAEDRSYLHKVAIKNTPIKLLTSPVFRFVITFVIIIS